MEKYLYHYGVPGMKWGIIRSAYKARSNDRLLKRYFKYSDKAISLDKKSQSAHSKYDLKEKNSAANKQAKYGRKSIKYAKKSLKQDSDFKRSLYETKSTKARLKSDKYGLKSDRLAKTTGYGKKALYYSTLSDKAKIKSSKLAYKVAKNNKYIETTRKKLSTLSNDQLDKNRKYVDKFNGIVITKII